MLGGPVPLAARDSAAEHSPARVRAYFTGRLVLFHPTFSPLRSPGSTCTNSTGLGCKYYGEKFQIVLKSTAKLGCTLTTTYKAFKSLFATTYLVYSHCFRCDQSPRSNVLSIWGMCSGPRQTSGCYRGACASSSLRSGVHGGGGSGSNALQILRDNSISTPFILQLCPQSLWAQQHQELGTGLWSGARCPRGTDARGPS